MRELFKIDFNPNRVYGLDILRFFAIFFIMFGHGNSVLPGRLMKILDIFALDGVSIFFVLSGFLIGGILIKSFETRKKNENTLLNFWVRRWFRTIPNYFLVLSILLTLSAFFTDDFNIGSYLNYFIFSQNLFYPHPQFFPEAWSLSIEEWFYLLIPIFIFVSVCIMKRQVSKSVLFTALFILVAVMAYRYIKYLNLDSSISLKQWDLLFRKQVFTRLDSLMYGMIGAYLQFYHKGLWLKHKNKLFIIGLSLLVLTQGLIHMPIDGIYQCIFSFSMVSVATLMLLPFLSDYKKGSGIVYKIVTYGSLTSYSMYLLNLSIVRVWILDRLIHPLLLEAAGIYIAGAIRYFLYWILTVGLSILLYKYFEIPMMNLRDNAKIIKWLRINSTTKH